MSAPEGKYVFGTVKVGDNIPQKAREVFSISPGDSLLVLGDEKQGIGLVKAEVLMDFVNSVLNAKEQKDE